ncbi:MAG: tRNA epoxyqueuosine(34) reductase QueG [Pseudopedobacter saltans]|uniref:Epoxyqueuosine reductase n=1 Tax=Pseudopedobacter saltans TaxID=151895 RepID=A0A2W5ER51_9SPHI|nr:MAG: tRNA epoxyqueuosine(34) reductase QueG [Pseudopedobacter saltans]
MDLQKRSIWIKQLAQKSGFDYCGIAKAQQLDKEATYLEQWLNQGMHGKMQYMENHFDMRIDPRKLVPGAKSVITFFKNYYPNTISDNKEIKISKYAYGSDYHDVIRSQLKLLLKDINEKFGEVQGRGFVDSAPVLERAWAEKAGIGWQGKNGMVINRQSGSFFFIATLIVDLELTYDDPIAKDFCGTCTRCIDACPTEAILPNKVVDGSKCISYFTIELKDQLIPDNYKGKFDNWMFGCDTCQDVCPWNRFSKPNKEPLFSPIPEILNFKEKDWEEMTEEEFKKVFKNSPLKRSKFEGIRRNLKFLNLQ